MYQLQWKCLKQVTLRRELCCYLCVCDLKSTFVLPKILLC